MYSSHQPIQKHGAVVFKPEKTSLLYYQVVLLIILSVLPYLYTIGNNFVYDDKFTITNNYLIRSWHKIPTIFTRSYFTDSGELSYRPVVTVSYFIDYTFWHFNPAGYHLTNLFLHSLNTLLLFFLLVSFFPAIKAETQKELSTPAHPHDRRIVIPKPFAGRTFIPFIASLVFCTHPVLSEAVNAVSYREDILVTTFYLASFLFYYRLVHQGKSILWYAASLICYFMGLFSKEMAITFPILVGLFDFLSQGRNSITFRRIYYYTGYLLVSVFYVLVRFAFLHNPVESYIPYPDNSLWVNFLTMSKVMAFYIKMLFFPMHLNADYVVSNTISLSETSFILSFFLIVSLGVIVCRLFFYHKILFFSALWFFVTLLPVMNVIPIENIMAERYLYIPLVGFCILGSTLLGYGSNLNLKYKALSLSGICILMSLILVGFSWQTCERSKVWFNDLTLWSETVKNSSQSSRAHNNLGVLYKTMGFTDAAIQEYNTAIHIKPDYSEAHGNLANAYLDKGLSVLDKKVLPKAPDNLAKAYIDEYYLKDAIIEYKKSLEICPINETAHFNLGVTYGKMGLLDSAETEYQNVLRINNNNPHAHNNLGNIYEDRGLPDKAITEYGFSISIDPANAITHNNIGNIHFKKGSLDKAISEYRLAIKNNPTGLAYHENLGNTYVKKGVIDEAIAEFELIIKMYPDNLNAYVNLITLYWNYKSDREKTTFYLKKLSDFNSDQKESINKMIEKLGTKK